MLGHVLAAVIFAAMPTVASETVGGSVSASGWPLPGVVIRLVSCPDTTPVTPNARERVVVSDADGRFTLAVQSPGTFCLAAELAGFETVTETIRLAPGENIQLALEMKMTPLVEIITVSCVLPNYLIGSAFDQHGRPVPGASARLTSEGDESLSIADSKGQFGFLFPASGRATFSIVVSSENAGPAAISGSLPSHGVNVAVALCPGQSPPPD